MTIPNLPPPPDQPMMAGPDLNHLPPPPSRVTATRPFLPKQVQLVALGTVVAIGSIVLAWLTLFGHLLVIEAVVLAGFSVGFAAAIMHWRALPRPWSPRVTSIGRWAWPALVLITPLALYWGSAVSLHSYADRAAHVPATVTEVEHSGDSFVYETHAGYDWREQHHDVVFVSAQEPGRWTEVTLLVDPDTGDHPVLVDDPVSAMSGTGQLIFDISAQMAGFLLFAWPIGGLIVLVRRAWRRRNPGGVT